MSVVKFIAVEGRGTNLDRSEEITNAIKLACYEHGDGAPLALVLGCLEIAKLEILAEQQE